MAATIIRSAVLPHAPVPAITHPPTTHAPCSALPCLLPPARPLPHPTRRPRPCSEQDVEIVDVADRGDALAMYYADATKGVDRDPVYCAELGLAVEQLKEGLTIEQLWSVL